MLYMVRIFLQTFNDPFFLTYILPSLAIGAILAFALAKKNKDYKASAYFRITKTPYLVMRSDLGKIGEYYTYKYLKGYEKDGAKFLFNIYIPKENGETTEIDVLMIGKKGLFVFESKNYSGWIFGSDEQKNWYQTLPTGRGRSHKEHFYNPIMQNNSHVKHLKALVGEQFPVYSLIVFSERCTLKNITVHNPQVRVIKRDEVVFAVADRYKVPIENALTEEDIAALYKKLYPYTQVSDAVKAQHIVNIQSDLEKAPEIPSVAMPQESALAAAEPNDPTPVSPPPMQNLQCPRCGGNLVLRTATKGVNAGKQFWGCEKFPKCRYMKGVTTDV